jgi:hypothetical protein
MKIGLFGLIVFINLIIVNLILSTFILTTINRLETNTEKDYEKYILIANSVIPIIIFILSMFFLNSCNINTNGLNYITVGILGIVFLLSMISSILIFFTEVSVKHGKTSKRIKEVLYLNSLLPYMFLLLCIIEIVRIKIKPL